MVRLSKKKAKVVPNQNHLDVGTLGPRFTQGGYNESIFCYILSLIAAFSSIMPDAIEWARNQRFFDNIYVARQKPLGKDWNPSKLATSFFLAPVNKQQDAAEMASLVLINVYTSQELNAFVRGCFNETANQKVCTRCDYEITSYGAMNIPVQMCMLNSGGTLQEVFGNRTGDGSCRKCNHGEIMSSNVIVCPGNNLIVQYVRNSDYAAQKMERIKAPTALLETLIVKDQEVTYKLCSVIVHSANVNVLPDKDDKETTDLGRGHYACIQPESSSSAILHNDDKITRLTGVDILEEYASKVALAFYTKVEPNLTFLIQHALTNRYTVNPVTHQQKAKRPRQSVVRQYLSPLHMLKKILNVRQMLT